MKLPAFQFYPGDWMKDQALRSVSIAARGLCIDMLCFMHENDRRGYFQLGTRPVTAEQTARMTGCSTDEAARLLRELTDSGVFSCTDEGVIFSRRMVRDEQKRQLCVEAGKKGGRPPLEKGSVKGDPKGQHKGEVTPSSSSSISSSKDKEPVVCEGVGWSPSGGYTGITDAMLDRWTAAYPSCNVRSEINRMNAWMHAAKPNKRPKDHQLFIVRWLSRNERETTPIVPSSRPQGQAVLY